MLPIVLALPTTYTGLCSFAMLDRNDWIGINALVVLAFIIFSSAIYAISGLLPTVNREKLRGLVKYEAVEGVISILIIASLLAFSSVACNVGAALSQQGTGYQDPFQFAHYYIGNLLFAKGVTLTTNLYSVGTLFLIDGNVMQYLLATVANKFSQFSALGGTFRMTVSSPDEVSYIFFEYSSIMNTLFAILIVVTFGLLFVMFLIFPIIESVSLTIVLPLAIIMRSLSFTGPRLRDAANTVIALAIAFYFILPLTIAMDNYITNWMYCAKKGSACNPYVQYLAGYKLNTLPIASLFTAQGTSPLLKDAPPLPLNYWALSTTTGNGGILNTLKTLAVTMVNAPATVDNFANETAQYLFEGIVLIALDMAITIGFAQGLTKGLNSVSGIMGLGPFWSA